MLIVSGFLPFFARNRRVERGASAAATAITSRTGSQNAYSAVVAGECCALRELWGRFKIRVVTCISDKEIGRLKYCSRGACDADIGMTEILEHAAENQIRRPSIPLG